MPQAEVTITDRAAALDDETVRERVMVIARDLGLAIHHVAVQTIAGRLSVSADLEVDGTQALSRRARGREPARTGGARRARPGRRSRNPYRAAAGRRSGRPRRRVRAHRRSARSSRRRSPPKSPISPRCTTCACARPPTARSSIFIAASIRRCRWPRCTIWSMRWNAGCAGNFRPFPRYRPCRAAAVTLSIRAQSLYITAQHAHRRTPPRSP